MIQLKARIRNGNGIHCRPSAVIIKEASTMASKLCVTSPSGQSNLMSIMDLLAMGLAQGEEVTITANGVDELLAAARLKELFERRFDFPPRKAGQSDDQVLSGM